LLLPVVTIGCWVTIRDSGSAKTGVDTCCCARAFALEQVTRNVDAGCVGCDRIIVTSFSLLSFSSVARGPRFGLLDLLSSIDKTLGVGPSSEERLLGRDGSGSNPAAMSSSYSVRSHSSLRRANACFSAMT
jgi:hypothetical protein